MTERGLVCRGWMALEAGQKLVNQEFIREPMGPYDVYMDVINCGICHTDIHLLNGDWGPMSAFPKPQISGHEIVGKIIEVGGLVSDLCIGDVVGFGFLQTACYDCDWCFGGDEHLCNSKKTTCSRGGQGGFANKFKGDSRACFKIPDGLDLKTVGPLMCAGITVYSPLKKWSKPGCNVGVLGIGGLGHLAIKFAKAMGFTVTAFSRTSAKRNEALSFGADTYIATSNGSEFESVVNCLDLLIVTINASVDWNPYIASMRQNGVIVFVGSIRDKPLPLNIFGPFIAKQLVFAGSLIGGSNDTKEMLEFISRHKEALPIVETMPMASMNEAIAKVASGNVRFRMVVEN